MTMFTEWLLLHCLKMIINLYSEILYTKNKIGELQDYEVPCDCINVTKLIKTNFPPDFYWETICLLRIFATKISEKK